MIKRVSILLFPLLALFACDSGSIVQEKFTVPDGEWKINKAFVAKVNITDTINPYNFYLNIRNGGEYKYSNLFVFVTTTFPNGVKRTDTIECPLADENGRWLGKGLGDVLDSRINIDNKVWYKVGKKFPIKGPYKFSIQHAMRDTVISAILNVGISIEQAN